MKNKLYATLLRLDRRALRRLRISDPYSLHRVVYSLFEDVRSETEKSIGRSSGIVYADQGGDFHCRRILVVSDRPPLTMMPEEAGQVVFREIPESLFDFERYRFRVVINPGRRDNRTRKIVPLRDREEIAEWFSEKSSRNWGFTVSKRHLQVEESDVLRFFGKNRNRITLARAALSGILEVVDRDRFRAVFAAGLGRGRAFGCGLLQIVPLRN